MINWAYFPKNQKCDAVSIEVIEAFKKKETDINSDKHTYESNEVLEIVRGELEAIGFIVEKGKKKTDKVVVPVLYGINGVVEKSFEVDGYCANYGYVIEVEAGRAVVNHQFLKDFFEASSMVGVDKLCIAVRNVYESKSSTSKDFEKVCKFFETMYVSGRLGIPLSSILIIGY